MMAGKTSSPMEDDYPNLKITDSNEVRKKQMAHLATPQRYSDLGSEVRDTPHSEPKPGTPIYSKLLKPGMVFTTPPKFTPFKPLDLYPQGQMSSDGGLASINPNSKIPESKNSNTDNSESIPIQNQALNLSPSKPNRASSSPAHKPEEVSQREGVIQASEDRISSLVQSLEDEIHKAGVNVNLSQLKAHIIQVREVNYNSEFAAPSITTKLEGEFVKVECDSPRHMQTTIPNNNSNPQTSNPP